MPRVERSAPEAPCIAPLPEGASARYLSPTASCELPIFSTTRTTPVRPSLIRLLLCCIVVGTLPRAVAAQSRLVRRIDATDGLLTGAVRSLQQDSTGFLWFGTVGGLHRWDGNHLMHWAPNEIRGWVNGIAACPDGGLYALEEPGHIWRITAAGATAVALPGPHIASGPVSMGCDASSHLWLANWSRVWRRAPSGAWTEIMPGALLDRIPEILADVTHDGAWLHTRNALLAVDAQGTVREVASIVRPAAVVRSATGDTLVLSRDGTLWRVSDGRTTRIYALPARGMALVRRGQTVFAVHDRYLVRVNANDPPMVAGPEEFPDGGGPAIVDAEGSLWLATPSGVLQLPEPETLLWNGEHGLPSAFTRFLARQGERIWVTGWHGTGSIARSATGWHASTAPRWASASQLAVDDRGTLWVTTSRAAHEIREGRSIGVHPWSRPTYTVGAEPRPGGGVWLTTDSGLAVVDPAKGHSSPPQYLPVPIHGQVMRVARTKSGALWITGGEMACRSGPGRTGWRAAATQCDTIPGAVEVRGYAELGDGAAWLASSRTGVLARRGGSWTPLPGNADLPSRSVLGIEASPSGGIWIYGHGMLIRVRPDSTLPAGWEELESVTAWQGVNTSVVSDVLEDPDGTVWAATASGVARIPAAARTVPDAAPRAALVGVYTDTSFVTADSAPVLPFRHHQIEVHFAAMSYRAPALLRYQVRLLPEQTWMDVRGEPVFRWIDLPRGAYRAEVRASLDGHTWSADPAAFGFRVLGPWYLEPWVLVTGALLVASALTVGYQVRLRGLLAMERQRTRIAMDLHDELGSGLGGVGILAGVLADNEPDDAERRRLARQVMAITEELGTALSAIVWSLDPLEDSLSGLAARLREHGTRLFSSGTTEFLVAFPPAWPAVQLGAAMRRSLLLIGLEALYNAARHARATRVTLSIAVHSGTVELTIEDDGPGVPAAAARRPAGRGLASMERRGAEVGAIVDIRARAGGGTVVRCLVPRSAVLRAP